MSVDPEQHTVSGRFRDLLPLAAAALLVAAAGVAPHLWFSASSGEISYFKYAYDEEFYGRTALERRLTEVPLYRVASGILMRALHGLTGSDLEVTLIVSDFVWPFLCALAAGYLAAALTRRTLPRILLILLFLFGQDIFSLGCTAVWNSHGILARLRGLFPPWGAMILPDYTTSYFSLYRTPEPQISWIVEFSCLGFLVRHFCRDQEDPRPRHWAVLLIFDLCLGVSYVFCAFPVIVLQFLLAAGALLNRRRKRFAGLAGTAMAAVLLVASGVLFQSESKAAASLLFHSRLPVLTLSVVASAVFVLLVLLRHRLEILRSNRAFFALAAVSIPMLLMDQQLVTGIMVSAKEWERYANYPLLVLGVAISGLLKPWNTERIPHLMRRWAPACGLLALAVLVCRGQKISVDQWRPLNEIVMAQREALRTAPGVPEFPRLLLEDAGAAPLLGIKAGNAVRFVLCYQDLFKSPIADMPEQGGVPAGRQTHQERLFEYFARQGKTSQEVDEILRGEAQGRGGFHLGFLFSFRDYWYPATDNRLVRQDEILRQIDLIVSQYRQYRQTPDERWAEATLFLTTTPPEKLKENRQWVNSYLASARAKANPSVKVYAYLQVPRTGGGESPKKR